MPDLRGWVPYRMDLQPEIPELHWCHTGGRRLCDPFFDDDLTRLLAPPFNRAFEVVTSVDDAARHLDEHPPLAPTAFIFHIGRCGSTLVSRMLAADPANRVLSEPAVLDVVLRAPRRRPVAPDDHLDWLRAVTGALSQPAAGESRLFVKLDSWGSVDAAELDRAFPEVPWLFIYRDPVEVLVSLLARTPMTLLPSSLGSATFGIPMEAAVSMPTAEYAARVLGVLTANLARWSYRAWLIEYPELPAALWPWLEDRLGVHPEPPVRAAMRGLTAEHAKFPATPFTDDRAVKQQRATPEIRTLVDRWVSPAYEQLRAAQAAQTGR